MLWGFGGKRSSSAREPSFVVALVVSMGTLSCQWIGGIEDRSLAPPHQQKPDTSECSEPDGTALADPTPGDCHALVCSGGKKVSIVSDDDFIEDGDDCTRDVCEKGAIVANPVADGDIPCALAQGAGERFQCGRGASGQVRCWGANESGQLGLGAGTDTMIHASGEIAGQLHARGVAVGFDHACAWLDDGTLRCWGTNEFGKAIPNGKSILDAPTLVELPGSVRRASCGAQSTCAVLMDGTVRCWGQNADGGLGDGTMNARDGIVTVVDKSAADGVLKGVVEVAVSGIGAACARLRDDSVVCWGKAGYTGDGSVCDAPPRLSPVHVFDHAAAIRAGYDHFCAMRRDGSVSCWGDNLDGESGVDGPFNDCFVLALPNAISLASPAKSLSAGQKHSCAALADSVACWGDNSLGQLGDPAKDPDNGSTPGSADVSKAIDVVAGWTHSCAIGSIAGDPHLKLYCWGNNAYGQLATDLVQDFVDIPVLSSWSASP
jgi:hypothetical protein